MKKAVVGFQNADPRVETVQGDEDGVSEGDIGSEGDSYASASGYEGDRKEVPDRMIFGVEECRVLFQLTADQGSLRVCGCRKSTCRRAGHKALQASPDGVGKIGAYDTMVGKTHVDGALDSWGTIEEYESKLMEAHEAQEAMLAEAGAYLSSRTLKLEARVSPTPSEDAEYEDLMVRGRRGIPSVVAEAEAVEDEDDGVPHFTVPISSESIRTLHFQKPATTGASRGLKSAPKYSSTPDVKAKAPDEATVSLLKTLTKTVAELQQQLNMVRLETRASRAVKPTPQETPVQRAPVPTATPSTHLTIPKAAVWYGVAKGRDGASGVFDDYEEARKLVYCVSNAVWQKFNVYEDAMKFVESYHGLDNEPTWHYAIRKGKGGFTGILQDVDAAYELVNRVSGASWKKFRTVAEAREYIKNGPLVGMGSGGDTRGRNEAPARLDASSYTWITDEGGSGPKTNLVREGDEGYRPPMSLIGSDPSMGQDSMLWGFDVHNSEVSLREKVCPPDLTKEAQEGLVNSMVDAVAQPGTIQTATESGTTEASEMIGQAMEELLQKGQTLEKSSRKTDLQWRSYKRTTLREITSESLLRKRIHKLTKLKPKLASKVVQSATNVYYLDGWTDATRVTAWACEGYVTRISRDSMDHYLNLHTYLLGLAMSEVPWKYVQAEIDFHVEELETIRSNSDSRLQAIATLYCYLRDGAKAGWYSTTLQAARNLEAAQGGGVQSSHAGGSMPLMCTKCNTTLHGGGKGGCPWKNSTDAQARKKASNVLMNWANGVCAPVSESPSPSVASS